MMTSELIYFEDIHVGQKYTSARHRLTAEEIKRFAQEFDPQPFHTDEALAESTFFKGLAASGWHTAAISMRLMVDTIPIAGGLIGAGIESLTWFRPVRPDDELWIETEVLSIRESKSKPWQGIVKVKHTTYDQHNKPVQEMFNTIIVPKRQAIS